MALSSRIVQYLQSKGFTEGEIRTTAGTNHHCLYKSYEIRQGRGGKKRFIEEPIPLLKKIQQALIPIYEQFPFHPECMALKGKGIADNAHVHENAKHVLRVDIKKCYPSTQPRHIIPVINYYIKDDINLHELMISGLVYCFFDSTFMPRYKRKGRKVVPVLPTGAPTSPLLCNIALSPIDEEIKVLTRRAGYQYTRYMDDMHLSTTKDERDWDLINKVAAILNKHDFEINTKKSRWMTNDSDSVVITGVQLGANCKVPREFRRMLRAKLQNLAKEGKNLDAETQGCLAYVKSIDETKYQKFLEYYERRRGYVPTSG